MHQPISAGSRAGRRKFGAETHPWALVKRRRRRRRLYLRGYRATVARPLNKRRDKLSEGIGQGVDR
jgi:hypothetical protein